MTTERPAAAGAEAPSNDHLARALRGFGPVGLLAAVLILAGNLLFVPLSALLVLAWAWRSHTPWRALGFVRPASWGRTLLLAVIFGSALKLVMKALVMPLLGAPPLNPSYQYLAGNAAAVLPFAFSLVILGAGFGEETVFRGYLFERLGKLLGETLGARIAMVVLTATVFGLAHVPTQGLTGAEQAAVVGLVFGTIFAQTGSLAPLMVAHAAFDLTAVALIYWRLESALAHAVFK